MQPLPPDPFDASEPRFRRAFIEVISRPEFSDLREQDYEGTFYTRERKALNWRFWEDLKRYYNQLGTSSPT
jgi:hypothetical protein